MVDEAVVLEQVEKEDVQDRCMPKILYLSHVEADFGGAFLYDGICQLIGERNVFDCPAKLSYHGQVHQYHLAGRPDPGATGPFEWMPSYENAWFQFRNDMGDSLSDDVVFAQAAKLLGEGFFDLVVIESCRTLAVDAHCQLDDAICSANVPVVVHDGEDSDDLKEEILGRMKPKLIMKREYQNGWPDDMQCAGAPVIKFPFSFPYRYKRREGDDRTFDMLKPIPRMKPDEREYDVVQMMGKTWPLRQSLADAIRSNTDYKWYVAINPDDNPQNSPEIMTMLGWHEYMQKMSTGKMALSCRGFGWDTCHYWETPWATVMLCDNIGIQLPNDFQHDVHCVKYNDPNDCVAKIKTYLGNPGKLEEIRAAGRDHLLNYHTTRERVRVIFDRLGIDI